MMNQLLKKWTLCLLIFFSICAHAQNTNIDKGRFMGGCYAMAVMVIKFDTEASPNTIAKVKKWAMNVSSAAHTFINDAEFDSIVTSEMQKISATNGYLKSQVKNCTSVLGSW